MFIAVMGLIYYGLEDLIMMRTIVLHTVYHWQHVLADCPACMHLARLAWSSLVSSSCWVRFKMEDVNHTKDLGHKE